MSSILYNPAGILEQIEHAEKAATRDAVCIALKYKDGVILGARKFPNRKESERSALSKVDFIEPETIEKIYQIDEHVAMVYAGLPRDADEVAKAARIYSQMSRDESDEPIRLSELAKSVGNYKSQYTKTSGYRILGMCMFLAGVDEDGIHLYEYEPHGGFVGVSRSYLGEPLSAENDDKSGKEIHKLLAQEYKKDMDYEEAKGLLLKCMVASYEDNAPDAKRMSERMEVSVIRRDGAAVRFERLSAKDLEDGLYRLERGM